MHVILEIVAMSGVFSNKEQREIAKSRYTKRSKDKTM